MNDRNKIAADFAAALAADFEIHGAAAIATLRETKPEAYLRLAAAIEPDEYTPESNFVDSLSDERVVHYVDMLEKLDILADGDLDKLKDIVETHLRNEGASAAKA